MDFFKKILTPLKTIYLLLLQPKKFVRESIRHDRKTNKEDLNKKRKEAYRARSAKALRNALFMGAALVLLAAILGTAVGFLLSIFFGTPSSTSIATLQVIAAAILLWATVSYLGWEIQTFRGESLIENVNRWIFRANYCMGTATLVCSLVWPL